jgi:tetratricopeptide (TPR) repeat protein
MHRTDDWRVAAFLDELAQPSLSPYAWKRVARLHREQLHARQAPALPFPLVQPEPLRNLLRHARQLASGVPSRAAVVGELAMMIARRTRVGGSGSAEWLRLEAEAWSELAYIHTRCSHLRRARGAALRAKALYRRKPLAPTRDEARIDVILGSIIFQQNDHERGLALVERAAETLRSEWHDAAAFARAKAMYGTLLIRTDAFERAMPCFHESLVAGRDLLDDVTIASNLYNHAVCALKLGRPGGRESLARAREKFAELDLAIGVLHCDVQNAIVLHDEGRVSEAISEMYKLRTASSTLSLPQFAARLTVTIVRWLKEQRRDSEARHAARGWRRHLVHGGLVAEVAQLDELLGRRTAA